VLSIRIDVNLYDTIDLLLGVDAFYDVTVAEVHGDWVSCRCDAVGETLNLRKCGLKAVPLSFVLFSSLGLGNWVGEYSVILSNN
jgi:hypothetical protein